MKPGAALDWLLQEDQPSIKYLALTQLLGRPENDPNVASAKKATTEKGWAAEILAKQLAGGWWMGEESLYKPKYFSTNWKLLILSDLGLTKEEPRIAKSCELWIKRFAKSDAGLTRKARARVTYALLVTVPGPS